jgi:hypothetical protein
VAIIQSIRAYNSLILLVDSDPSVSGAEAGIGSYAITSSGAIYFKVGTANAAWTLFYAGAAPSSQPVVEYRTLTLAEANSKALVLGYTPTNSSLVQLDIISGGPQNYLTDYTVSGTTLSWSGTNLDGVLGDGDKLRIAYYK